MGSPADIQFGRLAQERGWVEAQALRQAYARLGPGQSLPQALVAQGLLSEHHARQLWAEVQRGGQEPRGGPTLPLGPGAGAGTLPPPTSAAPSWGPASVGASSPTVGAPSSYDGAAGGGPPGAGGLPLEGEVVGGRFRVGAVLGKGGMGAVYRAQDLSTKAEVALKIMLPGADPDGSAVVRFQREAEAVVKVDAHAGIVRVRDFGRHRGMPYAALDLVVGRDLHELVKEQGGLPIEEALRLTEEVSRAIAHCHAKGVLHRDLKPANVLLRSADRQPFVTDFGLALDEQLERLTKTGQVMGTPAYMPPEQAEGDKEAMDERVDVYSLGAILYELVSGEAPFRGDQVMILKQVFLDEPTPLVERRAECPSDVDLICQKAMAKDKELRYASAAELAEDVARFRRGEPIRARPPTPAEREAWLRRRGDKGALARYHARWAAPLLLALALVVALAFAARLLDSEAKARGELALLLGEPLREALAPSVLAARDPKPYTLLLAKLLKDVATLRGTEAGGEVSAGLEGLRAELARDPAAEEALERPWAGLADDEDLAELQGLARRLAFLDGQPLSDAALASDPCAELWVALRGLRFGEPREPSAEALTQHGAALAALAQEGALAPLASRLSGALRAARARLERAEEAGWQALHSGQGAWKDAEVLAEVDALLAERELQGCFEGVKRALLRAVKRAEAARQLPELSGTEGAETFDLLVVERMLKEPSLEEAPLRAAATRLFLAEVPRLFEAFQRRDPEPVKRMAARPRLLGLVDPDPDAEAFQTYAYALIGAYQGQEVPAEALIQIIRCGVNVVTKQNRQDPRQLFERVRGFLERDARLEAPKWQWGDSYFVQARLYRLVREYARDADSDFRKKAVARYAQRPETKSLRGLALQRAKQAYDTELHVAFKREHDLGYWRELARLFARALAPEVAFELSDYGLEPLQPADAPTLRVSASWRTEVLFWLIEATRELVHDQLSVLEWERAQALAQGRPQAQAELEAQIRALRPLGERQREGVERILPSLDTFRSAKKRADVLGWLANDYLEWRTWFEDPEPATRRARELYARAWRFALAQLEELKRVEFREVSFGQLDRVNSQDTWIRALRGYMADWAQLSPREESAEVLAEMWKAEERVRAAIKATSPRFLATLAMIAVGFGDAANARRAIAAVRKALEGAEPDDERIEWLDKVICYEAMLALQRGDLARVRALYGEAQARVRRQDIGKNWLPVLRDLRAREEAQSSQGR